MGEAVAPSHNATGHPVRRSAFEMPNLKDLSEAVLLPLSAILFIRSPWVGLGLWFVLLSNPGLGLAGFLSLLFVECVGRTAKRLYGPHLSMEYRANGLLAGLVATWIIVPQDFHPVAAVLLVATIILITLFGVFLGTLTKFYKKFPLGVWPYCIVASSLFVMLPEATLISSAHYDWPKTIVVELRDLLPAFSGSIGIILFSQWVMSGALVACLVLLWSPAMFISGFCAWMAGALMSLALYQLGAPLEWLPGSYNAFFAGMALGAVYLRPGWFGVLVSVFAGAFCSFFAGFLQIQTDYSSLSMLPVPFMVTLTLALFVGNATNLGGRYRSSLAFGETPEQRCIFADWREARWGRDELPVIALPLRDNVEIAQGFDGDLTHRETWRHALDFQRARPLIAGLEEDRPSLWGAEVFSPVRGQVVSICASVHDNPIGTVNYQENWGNYVIVRSEAGFFVAICHLMQNSVRVKMWDQVDFSTPLGLAGNSGRSSAPHLHIQVQSSENLGAETQPFALANYLEINPSTGKLGTWRAVGLPFENDVVSSARINPAMHRALAGIVAGRGIWTCTSGAEFASDQQVDHDGAVLVSTALSASGSLRISTQNGESLEAVFRSDALRVVQVDAVAGGFIANLALVLSTIPYAAVDGLDWDDSVYLPRVRSMRSFRELIAPFWHSPITRINLLCKQGSGQHDEDFLIEANCRLPGCRSDTKISLKLSPIYGLVELSTESGNNRTEYKLRSFEARLN